MTSKFNPREIEDKWLKKWQDAELFKAKPDKERKKFYLTVAYPYPSGAMHIGHARTYTVPDVIARYKRMQGFNVLFPMAWHVTGSPVLGTAERIKRKDEKTLKIYGDLYRVPKETLETFSDPLKIVDYFSKDYKSLMNRMGYTIDWSREFITITPQYSKFIEWQYTTLKGKNLVKTGEHPVRYCPSCDNPVGDHDLMEGETASINEFTVIKFKIDDLILPAATLRPETVFGVTNMWLNPEVSYLKVNVDGETWLLSREAFEKLKFIKDGLKEEGELMGSELIGKTCVNPLDSKEVPILEASFVKPGYATGVVMSVPAHAPYDYIALKDLGSDIESIVIIDGKKYKGNPAEEIIKEMGITDQEDSKLEEATEILYREEHGKGNMAKGIKGYGGMPVRDAREKVTEELVNSGKGDIFYEFSEQPVICRCGSQCFVKILKDQWFVRYSDEQWKKSTHKCLNDMGIIPQETKDNFSYFIDWLNDWACTRRVGLGTKLPWDPKWIIEPLSDSTIYMAYYTISKHIREIEPKKLTPEVFDYIFLGKGNEDKISKSAGIPADSLKKIREEFLYWYPPEWRLSAKDLVGNHLTFHVFHHTAIFPKENWPKGMVVFGMGLLEGEKMSSSKGNIILLEDAIDKYGSDTIRMFLMSNAEPWQDFDWREDLLKNTARKLKQFYWLVEYAAGLTDESPMSDIDRWILSRINKAINETRASLDSFQMRKAVQSGFFGILNDLAWYSRRCEPNPLVMKEIANLWVRIMAPFTPFICEELWEKAGGDSFVSTAGYPEVDKEKISDEVMVKEDMIMKLREDIQNILEATKTKPKKIYVYPAPEWKRKLFAEIKAGKQINTLMQDPELKPHGKEISSLMKRVRADDIPSIIISVDDEVGYLQESADFLKKEFNCDVEIQPKAENDPQGKAKVALPMKPGIYFE